MQVLLQALAIALAIVVPHCIIRWDERRLDAIALSRGWNDASHWVATVAFSYLCLPVHFYRTRKSVYGLALGTLWILVGGGSSAVVLGLIEAWVLN